jgi:hypothetical protein
MSSILVPSGISKPQIEAKRLSTTGLGTTCSKEVENAASYCGSKFSDTVKKCWQGKLSEKCLKQVTAPPSVKRDNSCMQEVESANAQCTPELIAANKQCMKERLGPQCSQEIVIASQKIEQSNKSCEDVRQKWLNEIRRLCRTGSQDDQLKCIEKVVKPNENSCK